MEDWVVSNVETPVAKEINNFYKMNQGTIKKYHDILLEPTRKKYKSKAQVEMALFLDRTKTKSITGLSLKKLNNYLSALIQ